MKKLRTTGEWTYELLDEYFDEIEKIAIEEFGLDTYPAQLEVITSQQMLDAYSTHALPVMYDHWRFGKSYVQNQDAYNKGKMGLAYEIVSNTNPCIAYLMEENSIMMQALVMAHSIFGHGFVFKHNYMFKDWTDASSIVDYLIFAKKYIKQCEDLYGSEAVEDFLDAAHALELYGVDKYRRSRSSLKLSEHQKRLESLLYKEQHYDDVISSTLPKSNKDEKSVDEAFKEFENMEPEENILYFLEKSAPYIESWQREILRIVRKVAQYFYPQRFCKLLHEGFACVVGNTLIDTPNGLLRAKDIVNLKYNGYVDDNTGNNLVSNWFYNSNKKRVHIITDKGYELHGGSDHKIFIDNKWIHLSDLEIGQKLNIVKGNNIWPIDYQQLNSEYKRECKLTIEEKLKDCGLNATMLNRYQKAKHKVHVKHHNKCEEILKWVNENSHLVTCKNAHKITTSHITIPSILDENLAYWLGLMIGDGNINNGKSPYFNLTNMDKEVLDNFVKITKEKFNIDIVIRPSRNHFRATGHSALIVNWLIDELNMKSGFAAELKEVPEKLLQSPFSVVSAFIRGHMDTDGHVRKNGSLIVLVSKSLNLLKVEQQILLKMGILCSIRSQKDGCYRLTIGGKSRILYNDLIGFEIKYKKDRLYNGIINSKYFHDKENNEIVTIIDIKYDEGETYDFTVDNTHQYKAHGFLNHNCFVHYQIMNRLYEKGLVDDGFMLEFLDSHSAVIAQPGFDNPYYNQVGINVYALGFHMLMDVKRICLEPTDEDREYFHWAGNGDWITTIKNIAKNYRDESFIQQFLSPKIVRDFKMFRIFDGIDAANIVITDIHNKKGFYQIRDTLAKMFDMTEILPNIQVYRVDIQQRLLHIRHISPNVKHLNETETAKVINYLGQIWKFDILLESVDNDDKVFSRHVYVTK